MLLVNSGVSCLIKWVLLGRVKPGSWRLGGWYHTRAELVRMQVSAIRGYIPLLTVSGTPLASSDWQRWLLRAFGVKAGSGTSVNLLNADHA